MNYIEQMNNLVTDMNVTGNKETKETIKTIPSYEVAGMMEKKHFEVLRMIEGYEKPKVIGIIPVLANSRITVSDYFIESAYKDASGKSNKCYECTKLGCDMLANKMTGEKGVLFTAKYVKRFSEMEEVINNPFSD